MAHPAKINEESWTNLLSDRKEETEQSYFFWTPHKDVVDYCSLTNGTKRLLRINFSDDFCASITDYFQITSNQIKLPTALRDNLKSHLIANKQNGFLTFTVLDNPTTDSNDFENIVENLLTIPNLEKPTGVDHPKKTSQATNCYERDPKVKAWKIQNANGKCERCGEDGFIKEDDTPYLEVHHLQPLAENGADTPDNTVAICANCHRKLHYAKDKIQIRDDLVKRLRDKYHE